MEDKYTKSVHFLNQVLTRNENGKKIHKHDKRNTQKCIKPKEYETYLKKSVKLYLRISNLHINKWEDIVCPWMG